MRPSIRPTKGLPKKKNWIIWLLLGVLILGGGGGYAYYRWSQQNAAAGQAQAETYKTTQVRTGSIILSASGSGVLTAKQEAELSFPTAGTLAKLNVGVGDRVAQGDVLAELGDTQSLQLAVLNAQLALDSAQKKLDDLKIGSTTALADAQQALIDAQEAYDDAKNSLKREGQARCDEDTLEAYYDQYLNYQQRLDTYSKEDYTTTVYLNEIKPLIEKRDEADTYYRFCQSYTAAEIQTSQIDLTKAEETLRSAQEDLKTLQDNHGLDPSAVLEAENALANAEVGLSTAQSNLEGAVIKAPFSGAILTVDAQAGDKVGTSAIISMADLDHPQIVFYVDETDMDKVVVGNEAEVVFDAYPDFTYTGKVSRLYPGLQTINGSQVLQGWIEIDIQSVENSPALILNLNASAEIIAGRAENVLIVPAEALHDIGGGQYTIFVVENGQPRVRVVEVGLTDGTFTEIKSGLQAGETVTTGLVETQ